MIEGYYTYIILKINEIYNFLCNLIWYKNVGHLSKNAVISGGAYMM